MDYYLYTHSNDNGIFYVGKGKEGRADIWGRTQEWQEIAAKGYNTKIEANGTEVDILSLEKIVIKSLVEQGVNLVNKLNNPNWTWPEETKKDISKALKGIKRSDETKKKMSDSSLGKKHSDEAKKKMSAARVGTKNPYLSFLNKKRSQHNKLSKANNFKQHTV